MKECNAASPGKIQSYKTWSLTADFDALVLIFHLFLDSTRPVGFGAAANSFLDLVNVEEYDPKNTVPSGLHRSKDPGVGAFTTYHDRPSRAKVTIKKGQELFVNYGQHW